MTGNKLISAKQTGGFTLIELMVVIMIISILTAIGLSVGGKVLSAADRKKTAAHMQIIMHAINIYQEEIGEYPKQNANNSFEGNVLLDIFRYGKSPRPTPPNLIYENSTWNDKIKPIIDKLPDNAFEKESDSVATGFIDGYGSLLRFEPVGGLGGTPRLVSAGLDKNFNNTDDNIYSDK